ncbi:ADP-ribosylation [Daedalea quercina L-15889]|uniref:ADP-ribosylation n=1 Tax=Daedalea quercina L-15889 TaxID=1314783 RepID=A0A165LRY8_9APHY|nr:ADP-ribosylation [Daedalea quercina L-15889]
MSMCATRSTCQYPGCNRDVWQGSGGSCSAFCGKGHRDAMQRLNNAEPTQAEPVELCKHCQKRHVYVEGNRTHDFCGKHCSAAYQAANGSSYVQRGSSATTAHICKHPQCQRPVYVGPDGVPSNYCSNGHRMERQDQGEVCLLCSERPKFVDNGKLTDFCSKRCRDDTLGLAPLILSISDDMVSFKDVSQQFKYQWKHDLTAAPDIVNIWKIYSDKAHSDEFYSYKRHIEHKTMIPGGNSKRRWHGTIRSCTLGDDKDQCNLCQNADCSLCSIIRTSFHIAKAGRRTNSGRFAGIYASATSSKADDYVEERGGSPYKAMLLNDVVLGKTIKMRVGNEGLTKPPNGYDSVVGEPGGDLNYDEAIVYQNEAIRPLFLVVYN